MMRGRGREIDTAHHSCPTPDWASRGGGKRRAPGHPRGGPWRPRRGIAWRRSLLAPRGTLLHGQRAAVGLSGRGIAWGAERRGIRGTGRGGAGAPNTGRQGLGAAAAHLKACSQSFRHDVRVSQVHLDALCALRSAGTAGEVSQAEALDRLARAPRWVGVALAAERQRGLARDVGERPLGLAQGGGPQGAPGVAPDGAPLWLTDGCRESMTAWLPPMGRGDTRPGARPQAPPQAALAALPCAPLRAGGPDGPAAAPRQGQAPGGGRHAGSCRAGVSRCRGQSHPACIARLPLDRRQPGAAIGRRGATLCKGEAE
jgi:hypothetical protein